MKKFLFIIISTVFVATLGAQNVDFTTENFPNDTKALKQAQKTIKAGDKLLKKANKSKKDAQYQRALALEKYLDANEFNPNNMRLNYSIADCYYGMNNLPMAAKYGVIAKQLDDTSVNKDLDRAKLSLYEGLSYQLDGKYREAINVYKAINYTDQHYVECGNALHATEVNCFVDNAGVGVNTQYGEYTPVLNSDGSFTYVGRNRPTKEAYADNVKFSEAIYKANLAGTVYTTDANPIEKEGVVALETVSKNGNRVIYYSPDNGGDLMEAIRGGGSKAATPKAIKKINSSYHESSAAYSVTGDTLFFCSNRKGGKGGHDIYMSVRGKNGKYSKPVNLAKLNTAEDELSVFVAADGTLYFSSRGTYPLEYFTYDSAGTIIKTAEYEFGIQHLLDEDGYPLYDRQLNGGLGGYDIYSAKFDGTTWSTPQNVGVPINSPADDIYFYLSGDGKTALLSSDRNGGMGGLDIYIVTLLGEKKEFQMYEETQLLAANLPDIFSAKEITIEQEHKTIVKGTVIDAKTKQPIAATFELSDLGAGEQLANFQTDSISGQYTLDLPSGYNYGLAVKAPGYLFYSQNFELPDSAASATIEQVITLKKIEVNQVIVLRNIFFDVGKATLKKESEIEIENAYKLMVENPNINIEISGHTDNTGSAATNKKLSLARANSVINALVAKGIDKKRLSGAGFGPSQPVASNKTEEGRAQNRRIEFKIVKITN
ncbi:MAG: OmpA family protein [Bacteroidales bacterium]|jgi:outer membrane protein OmpA-like peptidoglycan-associated protein/tetratricopeptide (TPR) repeat protein|nr:OmpA family protein [Bacteroidales bacterium]